MDRVKKVFDQYGTIMDQEIVAVQLGCYSVALIGLTAAIRKVRPFSRFKRPNDIPNHFIEERRELTGCVKRIDPNGALLIVEHKPLISLPTIGRGELPVKILGVKVSGLGISWLQAIVVNSEITFIPVKKETSFVQCEVLIPNTKSVVTRTSVKKKESLILKKLARKENPFLNVGECLVKIGFADVTPIDQSILKENQYAHYYKSLHSAEMYALKKKLGMKYYLNPVKAVLEALVVKIFNYTREVASKVIINTQRIPSKISAT